MKTISVVLPVKNSDNFIYSSIKSILTQSYEDFELIIINDGSTDKTKDILLSIHDDRIVYLENLHSQGITKCLNKGLYYAKGKYIARMDADDISLPNRFKCQIEFFEREPAIDILGSFVRLIETRTEDNSKFEIDFTYPTDNEDIRIKLLENNIMFHPSIMMKRRSLTDFKLFYDKRAPFAEDYKLWIDALLCGLRIANVDEVLVKYTMHYGQTSYTQGKMQHITANKIKLAYAAHYFSNLTNWNNSAYLVLMDPSLASTEVDIQINSSRSLAEDMIKENEQSHYFQPEKFKSFITNKILMFDE